MSGAGQRRAGQDALVFVLAAGAVMVVCRWTGPADLAAPLLASAAVLARADGAWLPTLRSMLGAYCIVLAMAAMAWALSLTSPAAPPLLCLLGFGLCQLTERHHPPAVAALAVMAWQGPEGRSLAVGVLLIAVTVLGAWLGRRLGGGLQALLALPRPAPRGRA